MSNKQERVICAMSGGVDSSVAAKLLVDAGYDVMGVTMKLFDSDGVILEEGSRTCCSLEDVEDARAVAFGLGIPIRLVRVWLIGFARRTWKGAHPILASIAIAS